MCRLPSLAEAVDEAMECRSTPRGPALHCPGGPESPGVPGGRPPGTNDETTPVREHGGRQSRVEVAGIEPASFRTSPGLLRAQPALLFLSPGGHAGKPPNRLSRCLMSRSALRPNRAVDPPS